MAPEANIEVLSPIGIKADCAPWQPAPRIPLIDGRPDLNGKTVAFLWDYIYRGEVMFDVIEKELRARYPDISIHGYDRFGNIHGPGEKQVIAGLPSLLKKLKCDASVAGVGS
jgi:hypothetical protein